MIDNQFKENVNGWIKEIKIETGQLEELKRSLIEVHNNVQHDYELIYELKREIDKIKLDIIYIKLIFMKHLEKNKEVI